MTPEFYRYELFKGVSTQNVESGLGGKPFNLSTYKNRDPYTRNFAPKRFECLTTQACPRRQARQLDFEFDFLCTDAVKI
jgi:hypothetical protein